MTTYSILLLVRRAHFTDSFFPLDKEALPHLAIDAAERARCVEAQHALDTVGKLGPDLLAQRQEVVLLLPDEGAHEEEQDHGALAGGFAVRPRRVPQPALEYERRPGRRRCRHSPLHREDVGRRDLPQVRPRVYARPAVRLGYVFQVEHDVHAEGQVADRRLHGHLVRVQLHGHVARPRDVGRVRRDDGVLAQEPWDHLVDDGVVEQVQKVFPLVHQGPEPL